MKNEHTFVFREEMIPEIAVAIEVLQKISTNIYLIIMNNTCEGAEFVDCSHWKKVSEKA